jgi:nitrite reductase/ring-hydroxylating ferredoxin subunit
MSSVEDGGVKELRFGDGDGMLSILLYRWGEDIRAFVNSCPHFSLPLNSRPDCFLVMTEARVMCAWHCAVFRLKDGHCLEGPAQGMSLEAVPVTTSGGFILLDGP